MRAPSDVVNDPQLRENNIVVPLEGAGGESTSTISSPMQVRRSLTLLAPDVVEAILDGRQPPEITLAVLMRPFAVAWTEQRKTLIGCLPRSLAYLDAVA